MSEERVKESARLALTKQIVGGDYGKMFTYPELESIMGCDPRTNRHVIYAAAADALPDNKCLACKTGVGYFIALPKDQRGLSESDLKTAHKKTIKALLKTTHVDRTQLTREEQQANDLTQYKAASRVLWNEKVERLKQIPTAATSVALPSGEDLLEVYRGRKDA